MYVPESSNDHEFWLTRIADHLKQERYGTHAPDYLAKAKYFLSYLPSENLTVHNVQPTDIARYLNALKPRRRVSGKASPSKGLRIPHRAAIHMLLRLVHGRWPLAPAARNKTERFHEVITGEYNAWMRDLRGLAESTRSLRCVEARLFLQWLGERGGQEQLPFITVADLDAFVQSRSPLRRQTLQGVTSNFRIFLRHLHSSGRIPELASAVVSPRIYAFEGIPSALQPDEIAKVLRCTRQDRRPCGLRDYAILLLLSTYGLRAGEITELCLHDIDWTHDRLRVRHSKTGERSELPLLRAPGEAILEYLRRGRPQTGCRQIFVLTKAPYRAFREGTSLYSVLQRRLEVAGVTPKGKKGTHAFRHARATSLLKRDTPLKVIADVLGHRSLRSTMTYLKLDSEALRGVALELPRVAP
jgi:site-specific recombinase XerD